MNTTLSPEKTLPLTFSETAVTALKAIMADEQVGPESGLRVGVKGGGCSGMSYVLGFDAQVDTDDVFDLDGLRVLLDRRHAIYLIGMHVDFQDGLNSRGFTFNNPNAKTTCGCGTSFSA